MSSIEKAQVQQTQQWVGKTGKSGKQMVSYREKNLKIQSNERIASNYQENSISTCSFSSNSSIDIGN